MVKCREIQRLRISDIQTLTCNYMVKYNGLWKQMSIWASVTTLHITREKPFTKNTFEKATNEKGNQSRLPIFVFLQFQVLNHAPALLSPPIIQRAIMIQVHCIPVVTNTLVKLSLVTLFVDVTLSPDLRQGLPIK